MSISVTAGGVANDSTGSATSKALGAFNVTSGQDIYLAVALGSTSSAVSGVTNSTACGSWDVAALVTKNGTGVRVEIWHLHVTATQTGNVITVSWTPATTFAGAAEEYAGVSSAGNTGNNSGSSTYVQASAVTQDGGNFVIAALGFACQSGDTLTASLGTSRQSTIPAATAVGVALYDNTVAADATLTDQARISASRQWAAAALELRSGVAASTYVDYAAAGAPALEPDKDFRLKVSMPQITMTSPHGTGPSALGFAI